MEAKDVQTAVEGTLQKMLGADGALTKAVGAAVTSGITALAEGMLKPALEKIAGAVAESTEKQNGLLAGFDERMKKAEGTLEKIAKAPAAPAAHIAPAPEKGGDGAAAGGGSRAERILAKIAATDPERLRAQPDRAQVDLAVEVTKAILAEPPTVQVDGPVGARAA